MNVTIYTIGHSNHRVEHFLALLKRHDIAILVDVRSLPRSRHNPQFNSEELRTSLAHHAIAYHHAPGLGGFRRSKKAIHRSGKKDTPFSGYLEYMETGEFRDSIRELIDISRKGVAVIMCAEADPSRCHRFLISNALAAQDVTVTHIISESRCEPHEALAGKRSAIRSEQLTFGF